MCRKTSWCAVLFLLLGAAAPAQNLVFNAGFHNDLNGWAPLSAAWDEDDANGQINSGAALLMDSPIGDVPFSVSQCIPVEPDTAYQFGYRYRIPSGQPVPPTVRATLQWFDNEECGEPDLGTDSFVGATIGEWSDVPLAPVTAPVGAVAVQVTAEVLFPEGEPGPFAGLFDNVVLVPAGTCQTFGTTLCLTEGGRFKVTASFRTPDGQEGVARASQQTIDSGNFWFFTSNNQELHIKVLNTCETEFHTFWVFLSGLTNVEVEVVVEDTVAGQFRTYSNTLGQPFQPVLDTAAFNTCP